MKPITLRAHEVRRLQTAGEVLVVRRVKAAGRNIVRATSRSQWFAEQSGKQVADETPAGAFHPFVLDDGRMVAIHCPLGTPSERRWVRETWAYGVHALSSARDEDGPFVYAADGTTQGRLCDRWRSPVVMPRGAGRFVVDIAEVQARQVQTITEAEAIAAGVQLGGPIGHIPSYRAGPYAYHFAQLWDYMNGPDSWSENPWVWLVRVRRVEA